MSTPKDETGRSPSAPSSATPRVQLPSQPQASQPSPLSQRPHTADLAAGRGYLPKESEQLPSKSHHPSEGEVELEGELSAHFAADPSSALKTGLRTEVDAAFAADPSSALEAGFRTEADATFAADPSSALEAGFRTEIDAALGANEQETPASESNEAGAELASPAIREELSPSRHRQTFAIPSQVCLFEDFAELSCEATFEGLDGLYQLTLEGLSPSLYDPSLQISLSRGELLSAQVLRSWRVGELSSEKKGASLQQIEGERRVALARYTLERIRARTHRWDGLQSAWEEALAAGTGAPEILSDSYMELDQEASELAKESARAELELEQAKRQLSSLERSRESEESAQQPLYDRASARLSLQLQGEPGPCTVKVRYSTPVACWRPENLLDYDPESETLCWILRARTWQRTGQRWDELQAIFSTERSQSAEGFTLERPRIKLLAAPEGSVVELQLYEEEQTHDGRWHPVRTAHHHGEPQSDLRTRPPSIDDGGAPLRFRTDKPLNLAPDGEGVWSILHEERLPAKLITIIESQRSEITYQVLEGRLETLLPMPAGRTRMLLQGGLQGRASTKAISVGESFRFDFGQDERVRVHRELRTSAPSPDTCTRYTVLLTLSNLSPETRAVQLIEQRVVSLHEAVRVRLLDKEGWNSDDETRLTRSAVLAPRSRQIFRYSYEISTVSAAQFKHPAR